MTSMKEHSLTISLSAMASGIPIMLAVWFLIKPAVVVAVGDQLQAQVEQTVALQVLPINSALAVILRNSISNLARQIAAMEFRRDFPPEGDWQSVDVQQLTNLKLDLKSNVAALAALLSTPARLTIN